MEIETTKSGGGGGSGSTSSADNASTKNITISYLHRMIYYTQSLLSSPTTTTDINTYLKEKENSCNDSAEELITTLGQTLLAVCDPYNLLSSLDIPRLFLEHDDVDNDDLMTDNKNEEDDDDDNSDMDEDDQEDNVPYQINLSKIKRSGKPRSYTRIDALRSILRCLTPIAMDLGSRIASHVLLLSSSSSSDGKKKEEGDTSSSSDGSNERLRSYILFSYWVKDAPQLIPIVTDLFTEFHKFSNDGSSGCPLVSLPFVTKQIETTIDQTSSNSTTTRRDEEAAVIVCEATYELLKVYCNKQNEEMYLRKWWDWETVLFVLLHSHDHDGRGGESMMKKKLKDTTKEEDGDVVMTSSSTNNNNDDTDTQDTQEDNQLLSFYIGGYSPQTNVPNASSYKIPTYQMKWYISRCISSLFALRPMSQSNFLKKFNVVEEEVPFVRHPWNVNINDATWEVHLMNGIGRVVLQKADDVVLSFDDGRNGGKKPTSEEVTKDNDEQYIFQLPLITDVRKVIPLHPTLVHTGDGILLTRRGSVASYHSWCQSSLTDDDNKLNENETTTTLDKPSSSSSCFIPTKTTISNMSTLGVAMSSDPHPPPILVCGPSGSGKSSIVREMARQCSSFTTTTLNNTNPENELLELHIDEETDSKTLLGSYVATDIPGEFVWMAGPLTLAARQGRWVLIEDVDRCPEEIQAALIRLFEERILPLGANREEKCHPRFRLFGTCVTNVSSTTKKSSRRKATLSVGAGGKRILHPNLWRKVHVDPLPFTELRDVGRLLHPDLPYSVADAVLDILRKLDKSGRGDDQIDDDDESSNVDNNDLKVDKDILGHGARHASVREYIKLLSRISSAIQFEPGSEYATESQRLICLAETVDVFAMSCPSLEKRRDFICQLGAPAWNLTADAGMRYIESRIPSLSRGGHNNRCVEVGRARLLALKREEDDMDISAPGKKRNFAETNHALRLMESVAVCASQNEPALLVGETGCGKTTLVQRLANLTGRSLLVQNLSLQTDSTDLLGGYKPLEMRHVARGVYDKFVDLFVSSFSRSQNAQFLKYVLTAFEKGDWKKLAQCFIKAASMGENKMKELTRKGKEATNLEAWADFRSIAERFERQRIASESGLAFLFTEGALVDAIRTGRWVLLDEINLASSETLQRLCGLLDDSHGTITLTEKGDAEAVVRHPDFRLFAAMNPATDAGKKDLPPSIRSRFTELYVDELVDAVQLRSVAARYLDGSVVTTGVPLEHSESVITSVDIYLQCRLLSDQSLVDGGGQKPRYTMRTLCRTLSAARNLIIQQRFAPQRAILEGFQLAFEGSLDLPSRSIIKKQFTTLMPKGTAQKERDHPGRRPDGRNGGDSYVLIKPFWIKSGKEEQVDWADPTTSSDGKPKFVLTPSALSNLRRLCQAVASGPWSILLEGPTSAGKTTLVEYLAARCGHRCVRINNHEHTDIQEYTGSYAADSKGKISFQEGILVQALRKGHWVILDELNLAPSEVLEALNRLLDDNRELYLPEINEAVKPHENFRLFATQNPAGAYGGRKPLSRAFRNRFVEIHMSDIPEDEMIIILERRCGCPPSHAKLLVKVMKSLRQRRSRTGIFRGKDGLITPRDLLRWAGRGASSKQELAMEGYMLLAERLRIDEEKDVVRAVIEKELKVNINVNETYYGKESDGCVMLKQVLENTSLLSESGLNVNSIAPTQSIMRLLTLVMRCIKQKEPVLLVGDTGCGKTTVVQLLSIILQRQLTVVNCHASTETSDILGGFRPVRGRQNIAEEMIQKASDLVESLSDSSFNINEMASPFLLKAGESQSTPKQVMDFISELHKVCQDVSSTAQQNEDSKTKKKRKLSNGDGKAVDSSKTSAKPDAAHCQMVETAYREIELLYQKYCALFEWADGPLVCSMKDGSLLLLDEMSLAEDAVLERLNSVLEPSRTLTLAEKGGEGPTCVHESDNNTELLFSSEVRAHEDFRIFATMNPGGDFGKRELSPALRSRFTEIWVPPIKRRDDIDLVLERSFSSSIEHDIMNDIDSTLAGIPDIRRMMLDYFQWFNVDICDDPDSFCNDFKLSLRDILSWSRFIADVSLKNKIIDQNSAYVHGASLMHLDGLGLGTGVSNQDATVTRNKAKEFLLSQLSSVSQGTAANVVGFRDELKGIEELMVSTKDCFGINPFTITTGTEQIPSNLGFNLTAPTTGLNLRRVLRGMQISKPILLEGSPGVGKTSLIQALAKASGHHLVRINLSEQTDISDLMGSDLPYSGENDNSDGASSGASFRWCDGVLLKAIKRGDWVLLDELNLASQSVLEGLNSCLDHRASVYIPELGKSFDCPSTFRIFAAQNPLAQGGGRKGLPKSFLNRFTKVYIEALTNDDMFSIVAAQFPSIPTDIVERMIYFNEGVQQDIDSRLYGQSGSPWEFNLRDIFRWCQLLQSDDNNGEISSDSASKYADMLYTQRLRTDHDRALITKRFHAHFGSVSKEPFTKLEVGEKHVLVGTTRLERFLDISHWFDIPTQNSSSDIAQSLLRPMEAVACCVRMNWPCLLIGTASSGKSTLLKTLGDACNAHIETLAMTSSTDVTELIGCFEQTDAMGGMKDVLKSMKEIYDGSCLTGRVGVETTRSINKHYWHLNRELLKLDQSKSLVTVDKSLLSAIDKLVVCYEKTIRLYPEFSASYSDQITLARQWLSSMKRKSAASKVQSPFQWVDGILVKAMEQGYWLHLENVNYCPSSVLDRLNPLMEFGGELVMTECGIADEDSTAKPRVIQPHPNFRLFLSMNPNSHGEVSRAMRNRCIEVSVLPSTLSEPQEVETGSLVETIDAYTAVWNSEVRSHHVGHCMVTAHKDDCHRNMELQEDSHSIKVLKDWGGLFIGLLKRGVAASSLSASHKILYEVYETDIQQLTPFLSGMLITGVSTREDLVSKPSYGNIAQASRLLQVMINLANNHEISSALDQFVSMKPQSFTSYKLDRVQQQAKLLIQAICRLMENMSLSTSIDYIISFFDGFCSKTASQMKMVMIILNDIISKYGSDQDSSVLLLSNISAGYASRVPHLLEESVTYYQLHNINDVPEPSEISVIEVSYYIDKKRIDTSTVSCSVTPLLFPLFQSLDVYLSTCHINKSNEEVVAVHEHLLLCRDRLWQCLKTTQYIGLSNSQIGFEFTGFLIQYCWIKKAFVKFSKCIGEKEDSSTTTPEKSLILSFETIDDSIQESTGGSITSSDILWKKGGHPKLPSKFDNYEELEHLKNISANCSLAKDDPFGFTRMVSSQFTDQLDLKELIAIKHPTLFVQKQYSNELLGALAMAYWASTDETRDVSSAKDYSITNAPRVLRKRFMDLEADFVANINLATIDTSIRTVDNVLDMDKIKTIVGEAASKSQNSDEFIKNLLTKFADVQATQIGEIWCISEEATLLGDLTKILRKHQLSIQNSGIAKELQSLCHEIKAFINKSLVHTQWPVNDLRPYQTLLWALESESTDVDNDNAILHLIRSILPRMLCSYYNHQWCNTYNDLDSISCDLIGPALWNQEDNDISRPVSTPLLGNSTKSILVSSCAGPCRVEMNTNRSAIFRLLRLPTSDETSAYMTMENGDARIAQAKKLMPLFASQTGSTLHSYYQTEMIKFLLGSVFDAFEDVFGQDQLVYIKNLLESNTINNKTCEVTALFKHCKNKSIQSSMSTLLIPLIENIQAINESKEGSLVWKRHVDHAWVLIGLLRLNLIVPSSPIDPGRKPAAKVEQLDCYLQEIGSNLLSHSLHYGLSYGDFAPDSQATRHLSDLSDVTTTKRSNQEKKIIERPPNAPSFHDLFREIHHFCKTVANPSSVLALVETMKDSGKSSFRSQEINWQCSATSFCTRLSLVYSMYEDITIPCINEIRAIQRGLRGLALNQAPSPQTRSIVKTQDQLLQYPFRDNRFSLLQHAMNKDYYSQVLKELLLGFDAGGSVSRKQDTGIIHQSIQLAALLRLQIEQAMIQSKQISGDNLSEVNSLFSSLAHLPDDEDDKASTNNVILTEEERDEKEFRELFPDHGAEFNRIVASALDSDDFGEDDNDEPVVDQEATNNETDIDQLSDAEISLVVSLHEEMFSGQSSRKITDNTRIRAFLSSYEAASRLGHLTEWMEKGQDDTSSLGSHLFALLLRSNLNRGLWSLSGRSSCDSTIKDFHIDPYPSESIRADLPLRNLTIRVGQLLRAFPGHAVLVALGQVVERVRQLDIQVVALGKVMSGLEVILRKAQDWEQHASQHVTLGKPLKDLSSLVTSWRKLELQSWSNLLTIRESRRSIRAKRHWPRIYSLIHKAKESDKGITSNPVALTENSSVASPSWIWKGHPKLSASLGVAVDTKSIDELAKVLDAFILTSSIAEFSTRLGLVQSFAKELRNECEVDGSLVEDRVYLARMLQSLCNYYSRFAPLLMQTKTKLRDPIEKRIKDEVKLAKWDEQTYYSLAESSEKNYRKLMKFLRDYDEALDTTVLSILELNFAEGVRSNEQTQAGDHEPITTIPGDYSLFPKLSEDADKTVSNLPLSKVQSLTFPRRQKSTDNLSPDDWQAAGLTDSIDKYVLKINQYAKRMESIIPKNITSSSYDAAIVATELTDAIFLRIKSLREPNTTKQVKQRALVDLFKSLKDQGYSSMKWSVPSNIRDPRDMLQLPVPLFDDKSFSWDKNASSHLEKGESYYHRCQVEITRLRFEVSMFGSQYMSQREMTLMQGYSEYILFLISQQRCMISTMIQSVEDIDTCIHSYNGVTSSIPIRQHELSSNIASFEKYLSSLTEGLQQVSLLVKESSVLVDGDKSPIHDTVAILTSCVSTLEDSYVPCCGKMPITFDQIQYVETTMVTALNEVKSNIAKCVTVCSGILPATIFDSCMKDVNQALDIALSFNLKEEMTLTRSNDNLQVRATIQKISSLVQSSLLAVQSICTSENVNDKSSIKDEEELPQLALVQNHKQTLDEFNSLRLGQINSELIELSRSLISLHDINTSTNDDLARTLCTRATVSSMSLVKNVSSLAKAKMSDAIVYYQRHSKFLYVLLRVFRNLIAKGFCSDDVSDGGEGDGEGGAGEMKFEDDVEGTGMGEGDGKNDVTDEIENEEQLLGLKGDEEQEAAQQEKKELKEDEVDTGMEMEGDFEGEKFDLPDQPQDDNEENNSDNEEELDREMGDGDDPNEQVVDEKMWDNEEDDLEEMQQENEKFEENSKMAGEQLEDEMRTGDDDNKEEGPTNEEEGAQEQADTNKKDTPQDESGENDDQMDEKINDDLDENYEDKNSGVEVRNDEQDANGENGGEDDEEVDMDDLNLDDSGDEESIQGEDATGTEEMDEDMNPNEDEEDLKANNDQDGDADDDEEKMEEPETIEQVGDGGVGVDEPESPDDDEMEDKETSITAPPKSQYESNDAMGVAAEDGQDTVKETNEDSPDPNDDAYEGGPAEDNKGADEQANESRGAGGSGNDGNWQRGKDEEQNSESQNEAFDDVPNPFRSPGDAEKFWHKKLDMIQDSQQELDAPGQDQQQEEENKDKDGQFEYTQDGQDNSGQVLGVAEEDQAKQLEDRRNDEFDSSKQDVNNNDMDVDGTDGKQEKKPDKSHSSSANSNKDSREVTSDSEDPEKEMENDVQNEEENIEESQETNMEEEEEIQVKSNKASTDRMQRQDSPDDDIEGNYESDNDIQEIELSEGMTLEDVQQARAYWQTIQSDTNNLSRRLCEKLRLVMEPLVATKLRGDYRTGKRVNMKRIIGYIASGYRKDKIWLRRTKPAKRDYRVLIAVDDSESMQKSQAGDMALRALATLANGMSQLEIGQLGIASFGEDMNLLHPFNTPFTSESGVNVVSNFRFDAKRTRTALCVESSIASLEGASSVSSSMQLVFMISDGRIERDSRSKLRRLIRQMAEKNMLMVMIIVEGEDTGSASKGNDSILNMKEVSFVNGKPKIKHFIEDYPFPYYLVVGDLAALPEILGDCLRQWFEMLAQINNQS